MNRASDSPRAAAPFAVAHGCDEAKRLRDVDCPTPRCTREAYGTGWLVYSEPLDRWCVELHCPRCGETFTRATDEWQPMIDRCLEDGRGCG